MNNRILKAGFFILSLLLCFIYLAKAGGQEHIEKVRHGIKPEDYTLPSDAIELVVDYVFPTSEDEKNGIYLASPQGFCVSPEGLVCISDVRNSEVYVFDLAGKHLRTIGRFGQGPGEFMTPKQLAFLDEKLIVRDIGNMRVQFFDQLGDYIGGFRLFRDYNSFVACDGRIYGIPIVYTFSPEGKGCFLIDELDPGGRVINSFGELLDVIDYDSMPLEMAYLAVGPTKELWVSFMHFPIVRKYSLGGELLAEYRFSNGIVDRKETFNKRMMAQRTKYAQVPYYSITEAIHATPKGLYLLGSSKKRLDIFLMDQGGRIKEFYWLPLDREFSGFGIFALEHKAETKFIALNAASDRVEVYSARKR